MVFDLHGLERSLSGLRLWELQPSAELWFLHALAKQSELLFWLASAGVVQLLAWKPPSVPGASVSETWSSPLSAYHCFDWSSVVSYVDVSASAGSLPALQRAFWLATPSCPTWQSSASP